MSNPVNYKIYKMENKIKINNKCQKTNNCQVFCPEDAFFELNKKLFINEYRCTLCEVCIQTCPSSAIYLESLPFDLVA